MGVRALQHRMLINKFIEYICFYSLFKDHTFRDYFCSMYLLKRHPTMTEFGLKQDNYLKRAW